MGLSPSEKQRYNESKRRRRQAMESYATGKIKPMRSRRRLAWLIVAAMLLLAGAVALIVTQCVLSSNGEPDQKQSAVSKEQNSELLLQIVSSRYPLDSGTVPALSSCDGVQVNEVMLEDLQAMLSEAKKKGIELNIRSGYVSYDDQQKLFEQELAKVNKDGKYTLVKASAIASARVGKAGESEAQLGMLLTFDTENAKAKAFLDREGIGYGFILRFPKGKEDLTHRDASSSVFRYVGRENAEKMRTLNMCLEEFAEYN